jgi:hypothetical protein
LAIKAQEQVRNPIRKCYNGWLIGAKRSAYAPETYFEKAEA